MTITAERPETYRASLALVMPLIIHWRARGCKDGETLMEDVKCPACGGTLRMVKASWRMSMTGNCRTPFCVSFSE